MTIPAGSNDFQLKHAASFMWVCSLVFWTMVSNPSPSTLWQRGQRRQHGEPIVMHDSIRTRSMWDGEYVGRVEPLSA